MATMTTDSSLSPADPIPAGDEPANRWSWATLTKAAKRSTRLASQAGARAVQQGATLAKRAAPMAAKVTAAAQHSAAETTAWAKATAPKVAATAHKATETATARGKSAAQATARAAKQSATLASHRFRLLRDRLLAQPRQLQPSVPATPVDPSHPPPSHADTGPAGPDAAPNLWTWATLTQATQRSARALKDALPSPAGINRYASAAAAFPFRLVKRGAWAALKHLLPAPIRAMNRWTWIALALIFLAVIWAISGVLVRTLLLVGALFLLIPFLWRMTPKGSPWAWTFGTVFTLLAALALVTFGVWLGQQEFFSVITNFLAGPSADEIPPQ